MNLRHVLYAVFVSNSKTGFAFDRYVNKVKHLRQDCLHGRVNKKRKSICSTNWYATATNENLSNKHFVSTWVMCVNIDSHSIRV